MKKYFSLLLIVFIAINSCEEDPLPTKGDIAGRITEEGSNNAISAATIIITGSQQSYKTGEDGSYKISDLNAGDYSVTVSKQGYVTDTKILTVKPEKTTPGDFSLIKDIPIANPNFVTLTYDNNEAAIELENTRSVEMQFTTQTSKSWLTVNPASGVIAALNKRIITISADLTSVAYGNYNESLVINVGEASLSIPINVIYEEPPYISITSPSLDNTYKMGEVMPITWNSNLTGKVKIDLLRYSSIYYQVKEEIVNEEGGNYSWQIPAIDSANYQLKVSTFGDDTIYSITGAFKIIPGPTPPTVQTTNPENITLNSITIGGTISHIGLEATQVDQYGHVYSSVNPNPTISDSHTSLGTTSTPLDFSSNLNSLTEGTTYYIAAYATNTKGTSYGDVFSISTLSSTPTVQTAEVVSITQSTAIAGGNVLTDGGTSVTERGICWNTSSPASITDNYLQDTETGTGAYTINLTELNVGTTYYVRAYAKNSSGIAYGQEVSFKTIGESPTVTTNSISQLTSQTVNAAGTVEDDGGETIISYGFCYSNSSQTPTVNDTKIEVGNSTVSQYNKTINGLSPNTNYYLRAYATNSLGTAYGAVVSFTTLTGTPTVETNTATVISGTKATATGYVFDGGDSPLTSYGFCFSTTSQPTISDDVLEVGTSIQGSFSGNLTNLIPQTQYYVRSYATNNIGTSYGTVLNFATPEGNYLSFSSPYAGEEYTVGETHNINWSSNYSDRRVIIEHWFGGNYTELTNNANISDNSFAWLIPEETPVGTNNTIKITDYNTLDLLGESPNFTIPGNLELTQPYEGFIGQLDSVVINWVVNYTTTFTFELYQGTQFKTTIGTNIDSDLNELVWDAEASGINTGKGFRLKIIDENNITSPMFSGSFELIDKNSFMKDDRDGKLYKIVTIGEQTWFAQDLNFKTATSVQEYYGQTYRATEADIACPDGWHLPSDIEWKTLEIYIGMTESDANVEGWRYSGSVGNKLK